MTGALQARCIRMVEGRTAGKPWRSTAVPYQVIIHRRFPASFSPLMALLFAAAHGSSGWSASAGFACESPLHRLGLGSR